jgi:hypothetical protein
MIRTWGWLFGAVALTGCLSLAEVRSAAPARTGEAAGHYLPLAGCVAAKAKGAPLSEGVSYEIEDSAASKTARVVAIKRYPGGLFYTVRTPLVELTFREPDEGRVKVETRHGPLGWPLEAAIWPLIGECAGGKV